MKDTFNITRHCNGWFVETRRLDDRKNVTAVFQDCEWEDDPEDRYSVVASLADALFTAFEEYFVSEEEAGLILDIEDTHEEEEGEQEDDSTGREGSVG